MDIDSAGGSLLSFFKPDTLAPLALLIGIILIMFIKKNATKNIGMICIGFGILFTGLLSMTDAVEPLAESQLFIDVLSYFSNVPILGIVTGLVFTVIIQSSSAMVGILQALSVTGAVTFNLVYPMIMGINLGTCVTTALVCSIGSSKDAKRTGVVHIVFNCIGTVLFMIVMSLIRSAGFFPDLWNSVSDSGVIANFQTLFNLVTAIVLLPFTNWLVKLSCLIVKEDPVPEDKYPELAALDEKLIISPALALESVSKSLTAMIKAACDNVALSFEQFKTYDEKRAAEIEATEERIDQFTDNAENYFVQLSKNIENDRDNRLLNMFMQCTPNVERIGDYATNFDEMAKKLADANQTFSEGAQKEFEILSNAVLEILHLTVQAIETDDEQTVRRIEPFEEVIDDMVLLLKNRHTARLRQGICSVDTGLVFMDALTHLERSADQCSSIAMLILGKRDDEITKNHHRYLHELHSTGDQAYLSEHQKRREQYLAPLEAIQY